MNKIPCIFPASREFGFRDEFAQDCLLQRGVSREPKLPRSDRQSGLTGGVRWSAVEQEVLMRTVDRLNLRFGRDTISFAAAGRRQRPWGLRRELLSPCYTTDLG